MVLVVAGVCVEDKDIREWIFKVFDLETTINFVLLQIAANLEKMMDFSFVKALKMVPSCVLQDFIVVSLVISSLLPC